MTKYFFFFLLSIISFFSFGIENEILINQNSLGHSISNQAIICEDKEGIITIEQLIENSNQNGNFEFLNHEVSNMDFTTSTFWIKFKITNQSHFNDFIIETARPITNIAVFYEVLNGKILNAYANGDDLSYNSKKVLNRKIVFPLNLSKNESRDIYIKLKSDGEVLTLPLIIHDKESFHIVDSAQQFQNGIYYGILLLIVVIYLFFYLFLKDKSFLYYISYVSAIFILQFSLDGYSYQYLFPNTSYLANHIVLFSASLTMFLLLQYAKSYLNLKSKHPKSNSIFNGFQITILILGGLSLIPGVIYQTMYPLINGFSLLSILLILFTIFKINRKGSPVCGYFSIAFTVFIAGAIIFILGNFNIIFDPIISQNALKISSGLEVIILSISMATKYRDMQNAKERIQAEALVNLTEKNKLMDNMNHQLEIQVKERTFELNNQKEVLEEKNTEILSSIQYALRIQQAILPTCDHVETILSDYFIFYKPKDVVSGDFYFVEETHTNDGNKLALFGAIDCTGHGVPGAFMSIVGNSYLRQSTQEKDVNSTGDVLDFLNKGVCKTLRQDKDGEVIRDGMDAAICALNSDTNELYFSGAKNPVYIISDTTLDGAFINKRPPITNNDNSLFLSEFKGDSHPIGTYITSDLKPFSTHKIQLKKGDVVYLFTDGFADQFGGEKGKKYNVKKFKQFLLDISQQPLKVQHELINKEFMDWKGDLEQVDDICIIGVRV